MNWGAVQGQIVRLRGKEKNKTVHNKNSIKNIFSKHLRETRGFVDLKRRDDANNLNVLWGPHSDVL